MDSPWGSRQPDPYFSRAIKIYQLSLKKGLLSPFEPPDELHPDKPEEAAKPADATKPAEPVKPSGDSKPAEVPKVEIDLEGIITRIQEVPVPPGNYANLAVA